MQVRSRAMATAFAVLVALMTADPCAALTADVQVTEAGPVLRVNGSPVSPTLFYVSLWHDDELTAIAQREIADAAKNGVTVVSFAIWGLPWFREDETPDYSRFDVDVWVEKVLAAHPDVLLLPRFPTDQPPAWWREEHPGDVMCFDDGERDGGASIHSRRWREDASRQIRLMVRHLEEKYGDRIIGYHPCGQTSAEWFYIGMWDGRLTGFEEAAATAFRGYLRRKYATTQALRRAWNLPEVTFDNASVPTAEDRTDTRAGLFRDPATQQRTIDFADFQNLEMADAVTAMCHAVKEAAPGKLAVAFYGYHFELAGARHGLAASGHLGMARLLESPDVDIVCSPVAYGDRQPGGGGYFMSAVDSVQRNGRLWLVEDDTRTHLSAGDAVPGRCATADETYGVLERNFAHVLTHGAALWWMDIGGRGCFDDAAMWGKLGRLQETYTATLPTLAPYAPEIAAIVDERSCSYLASPTVTAPLIDTFRRQWYRTGAPVGVYLLDDLVAGRVPPAKLYLFLDTFALDEPQCAGVRRAVESSGATAVFMYAPGLIRDGELDGTHIADLTGIHVATSERGDGRMNVEATGEVFDAGHGHLSPGFIVDDPDASPLARYVDGGEVAMASKELGAWTSVYCGALQMPAAVLWELAVQAGVHLYSNAGDIITAGNGFVGIHASTAGEKHLTMPVPCRLTDVMTGASLKPGKEFAFTMALGETRLFRVSEDTGE